MNTQLMTHLQTFDSDDEFSESPDLVVEEHVGPVLHEGMMNPLDQLLLRVKGIRRQFMTPETLREALVKVVWLLPVAILLADYIGFLLSFSLSLAALVVLQMKPEIPNYHMDIKSYPEAIVREIMLGRQQNETKRRRVNDCRREVSRLLGLIGAPPLAWGSAKVEDNNDGVTVATDSMVLLVKFVEAHSQLLLMVDEAYRWLQVSASLHLGLGPRSQCVERVERASIAKKFRTQRRRLSGAPLSADGVKDQPNEPQRGVPSSVLALASVRQHVASALAQQSDSLLQVWDQANRESELALLDVSEALKVPDVIDLGWIKSSRQHVANLLTQSMELYCTSRVLPNLSIDDSLRHCMETSLTDARNARDHLMNNLLLGKTRSVVSVENPNDPLLLSLIQYREHLNALSGAIWSCQQVTTNVMPDSGYEIAQWWGQIQQLSAQCRSMELEMQQRFFPMPAEAVDSEEAGSNQDVDAKGTPDTGKMSHENYEHGEGEITTNNPTNPLPTKIQVFRGHGTMEEKKKTKSATKSKGSATQTGSGTSIPPRDSVSEHLMVQELQNRIAMFRPDEEDEEEVETEAEKKARLGREPARPLFLGASGSLLDELKLSLPTTDTQEELVSGGD